MVFQQKTDYPIQDKDGQAFTFTAHHYIHRQKNPELFQTLISGKIFRFEHPDTQEATPIPFPCLLEDAEKKFLVFFIPAGSLPQEKIEAALFEGTQGPYDDYTLRITESITDFFEKINILDSGYLDTEVEALKILTYTLLQEQNLVQGAVRLYFQEENNVAGFAVIAESGDNHTTDYNPQLLKIVQSKLGQKRFLPKGQLFHVDPRWAIEALELN